MEFECGCYFGPDDPLEACCPIHGMPMKIGTINYDDLEWAYRELGKRGVFGVEEYYDE